MAYSTLRALQIAQEPLEKAAIVAEAIFALLPMDTARAARRCVVVHWFDQSIVEAMLEDSELTLDEMHDIYEQLTALPCIEAIPSGLMFQRTMREGLLKRYRLSQPELLQMAARLAAPVYEARENDEKNLAEAFFCYIVAGDQEASIALQNMLFERGSSYQDWYRIENILRLQDEAEKLPFVQPLPRTEQYFLLRGLIHRMNGKQSAALFDYNQVLILNRKSVIAYISRGTTYAEQKRFDEALDDYNTALRLDKEAAQAYIGRGMVHAKQARHAKALKDFDRAIEVGPPNSFVFRHKGEILSELGRYEEAVVAYGEALRFNPEDVAAYVGRGQDFNRLENYAQALISFEEVLRLDSHSASAYRGKGDALNGLGHYVEALVAYDKAIELDANSAEAYRGKGKVLRSLRRYAEASAADIKADQFESYTQLPLVARMLPNLRTGALSNARNPTTVLRQPVVIRGTGKKSSGSMRPPQGRRLVIHLAVTILLIFIVFGTLMAVVPAASEGTNPFNLFNRFIEFTLNNSRNTALLPQQAATATAVTQDGFDPGNGTYAGVQGAPADATGGSLDHFFYGQCTYWANMRYHELTGHWVPWRGDAAQWYYDARMSGWAVSSSPHLYSIIVLQPGVQQAGWYGHVAVVEKINSDGSVLTSNWNWQGNWGRETWVTFQPGSGVSFVWYPGT